MFVRRAGGVVNAPSGGRWEARVGLGVVETEGLGGGAPAERRVSRDGRRVYVRGVERDVMNHVGVVAPLPAEVAQTGRDVLDVPPPRLAGVTALPPRAPLIRLGRLREAIGRARYAIGVSLVFLAVLWLLKNRRKRRSRSGRRNPPAGEKIRNHG